MRSVVVEDRTQVLTGCCARRDILILNTLPDELQVKRAEADVDHNSRRCFLRRVGDELLRESGHGSEVDQEGFDAGCEIIT